MDVLVIFVILCKCPVKTGIFYLIKYLRIYGEIPRFHGNDWSYLPTMPCRMTGLRY